MTRRSHVPAGTTCRCHTPEGQMAHPYHSTVPSGRYHPLRRRGSGELIEESSLAIDEQHVALPKLYGAPAYARPARPALVSPRPIDPDDLPIEAVQTPEERELAANLPAHAYTPGSLGGNGNGSAATDEAPSLQPRPLSLRALAGRILGQPGN
jgi:hypothetical protein